MGKTDFLEHEVLKWCTGQANFLDDGIITPYIGLFTVAPTDAGGGTEVSGGSYARQSGVGKFGTPSGGAVSNSSTITFPTATANWGTVVAYGLFTASSAGTLLRWKPLTTSTAVNTGFTLSIAATKLTLTED
jgi:hypothetical protein